MEVNEKKYLFITDALEFPYDEGFRKFALYLFNYFKCYDNNIIILNENHHLSINSKVEQWKINKLFLDLKLWRRVSEFDAVIYLPLSSVTFLSILRSFVMSIFTQVFVLGLQRRNYNSIQKWIIKRLKKIVYILQYNEGEIQLFNNIIPFDSGVDKNKFYFMGSVEDRNKIKEKYHIPIEKTILLHVGHIKKGRNLDDLLYIQKQVYNSQVVIVGSTSTSIDFEMKKNLLEQNVIIIDAYIENIVDLYNIADYYLFLVKDSSNFISKPLSVLEALACGVPVIAYKDVLEGKFGKSIGINYFDNIQEIISALSCGNLDIGSRPEISELTRERFSWENVIGKFMKEVERYQNV